MIDRSSKIEQKARGYMQDNEAMPISMLYSRGNWGTFDKDPLGMASDSADNPEEAASYFPLLSTSEMVQVPNATTWLSVWRTERADAPRYRLELCGHEMSEEVYVATFPDLMELLAVWVPVVQGLAFTNLLTDLREDHKSPKERRVDPKNSLTPWDLLLHALRTN